MLIYLFCLGLMDSVGTPVNNPAGINSAQVFLSADVDHLYMTWIETEDQARGLGTIYFSAFDGQTWTKKVTVFTSEDLFINWADFPKHHITSDMMVVGWPQKLGPGNYAYGIRIRVSEDKGQSWSDPFWLHEDLSESEHGFVSFTSTKPKSIEAIWLDGRMMAKSEEGKMQLRHRTINIDSLGPERVIDNRTCECCGTDFVSLGSKSIAVYRDQSPEHIRDIYISNYDGQSWSPGEAIRQDKWKIHGCPVNGASLDAKGQQIAVAWFTMAEGPKVFLTFSKDMGKTFEKPVLVTESAIGRVDTSWLDENSIGVVWIDQGDDQGLIKMASLVTVPNLKLKANPIVVDPTPEGRISGFPRMQVFKGQLYIAFQDPEKNAIKIKKYKMP